MSIDRHWKTPLYSIPIPSNHVNCSPSNLEGINEKGRDKYQLESQNKSVESRFDNANTFTKYYGMEEEAAVATSNNSSVVPQSSILVPFDGLYGFILGQNKITKNANTHESSNNDTFCFESKVILNEDTSKNDETSINVKTSKKGKKSKKPKTVLPIHCGCTFRATFQNCSQANYDNNNNVSSSSVEETKTKCSIMLPLTSQIADPVTCNIISSGRSGDNHVNVITSTNVARLFYIQKGTKITIEYTNVCEKDSTSENCDKTSWKWGLFVHQIKKYDNNSTTMVQDKTKNHESTHAPQEKKARLMIENERDDIHKNDPQMIDFFPNEARKKPLLCTACFKKFPTAMAIYKHSIISHIETMAPKGSKIYNDIVGPPIFHKPLHAAYDDQHVVVVVKHQGLAVQGTKWTLGRSDLLMPFRLINKESDTLSKPRAVHRLDSATGGLLVVAKTHSSEKSLKMCFADRSCKKRYRAIVFGRLEGKNYPADVDDDKNPNTTTQMQSLPSLQNLTMDYSLATGTINSPINGKDSVTHFSVVSYTRCLNEMADGWITTVDLYPVTGRQHQLRKHMKLVGHPIWGDRRYSPYYDGKSIKNSSSTQCSKNEEEETNLNAYDYDETKSAAKNPHSRLCLWALEIIFPHPVDSKNIHVKINEPEWYCELREDQEKKWKAVMKM